jgi:hypothetical protein
MSCRCFGGVTGGLSPWLVLHVAEEAIRILYTCPFELSLKKLTVVWPPDLPSMWLKKPPAFCPPTLLSWVWRSCRWSVPLTYLAWGWTNHDNGFVRRIWILGCHHHWTYGVACSSIIMVDRGESEIIIGDSMSEEGTPLCCEQFAKAKKWFRILFELNGYIPSASYPEVLISTTRFSSRIVQWASEPEFGLLFLNQSFNRFRNERTSGCNAWVAWFHRQRKWCHFSWRRSFGFSAG